MVEPYSISDIKSFLQALDTNTLLNKIEMPANVDLGQKYYLGNKPNKTFEWKVLNTNSVTNGTTNLYFNESGVISASPSADIPDGLGDLVAGDSLLSAFEKLEAKKIISGTRPNC